MVEDATLWNDNDDGTLKKNIKNTRNTVEWNMLHRIVFTTHNRWTTMLISRTCVRTWLTCPCCSARQFGIVLCTDTTHDPEIYYGSKRTNIPRPSTKSISSMHTKYRSACRMRISIYLFIIIRGRRMWSVEWWWWISGLSILLLILLCARWQRSHKTY